MGGKHFCGFFAYPGLTDGRGGGRRRSLREGGRGGGGGEPWAMLSIRVDGLWEMTGGYHTCPACRVAIGMGNYRLAILKGLFSAHRPPHFHTNSLENFLEPKERRCIAFSASISVQSEIFLFFFLLKKKSFFRPVLRQNHLSLN